MSWTDTLWMWQAMPKTHIPTQVMQEVGEKRGRLYEPKAGSYSEAGVDNTTYIKGVKKASSAWGATSAQQPLFILPVTVAHFATKGVKAQHHSPPWQAVFTNAQRRWWQSCPPAAAGCTLYLQGRQGVPIKRSLRTTNWNQLVYLINFCLLKKNIEVKHF